MAEGTGPRGPDCPERAWDKREAGLWTVPSASWLYRAAPRAGSSLPQCQTSALHPGPGQESLGPSLRAQRLPTLTPSTEPLWERLEVRGSLRGDQPVWATGWAEVRTAPHRQADGGRVLCVPSLEGAAVTGVGAQVSANELKLFPLGRWREAPTPCSPNADSQPRSPVRPRGRPLEGPRSLALPCGALASHPCASQGPHHSGQPRRPWWPHLCPSWYWGPRRSPGSMRKGGPVGRHPTQCLACPVQPSEGSRPAWTGWSFYFYIRTSRCISRSSERLVQLQGPWASPRSQRQPGDTSALSEPGLSLLSGHDHGTCVSQRGPPPAG